MAYKPMEEMFTYRNLNKNDMVNKIILTAMKEGTILNIKEDFDEAFMVINKNFKFPLKHKILEELEKGELVLLMAPKGVKIPSCLPFFLQKNSAGKIIAVVNVGIYGHKIENRDGSVEYKIDPKKLYTMLEGAYIAKLCFFYKKQIASRNVIIRHGSLVYSHMILRVINKKYSISIDKNKVNKVVYLASKFFMINLLGMSNNEACSNYAISNCKNANPYILTEVDEIFKDEDYKDISTFLTKLKSPEIGLGLDTLTVRMFLETFINMYDAPMLFGLESFPFFMYNIISVTNGAYINNQYILEDIVDIHGGKLYHDLEQL